MKQIAWFPPGMAMPAELISAKVAPGAVTEQAWLQALSSRLDRLVAQEPDPSQAIKDATRALNLPAQTEPSQAGSALVMHNLELRTAMSLSVIDKSPFPATVSRESEDAAAAMEDVDLMAWVDLARSAVSASSLD